MIGSTHILPIEAEKSLSPEIAAAPCGECLVVLLALFVLPRAPLDGCAYDLVFASCLWCPLQLDLAQWGGNEDDEADAKLEKQVSFLEAD